MISIYSINYPALACFVILAVMGLYLFVSARRNEYGTTVIPSSFDVAGGAGTVWSTSGDFVINSNLECQRIVCRTLYVGPRAQLFVREVAAENLIVEGSLRQADIVQVRGTATIKGEIEAKQLVAERLVVQKRASAKIRIVPAKTQVIRKKGSHTTGFFSSVSELQEARQSLITESSAKTVRLVRRN